MINKRKILILTAIFGTLFGLKTKSYAGELDTIKGYIFPEIDFKYVDFLTDGHLHKNKPHYGKYNWKVLESPHFQIYTYGNDDRLGNLYLETAEETYKEYSAKLNMNHFTEKIRVIIFNSARDFEETNLIWGMVPKGLGGQTEMIKWKRVLVAFRDSPSGFRRLLRHELTHRYQAEFMKLTLINFMFRDVPLWFTEGSAEHLSHHWNAEGDLIMRDAYLNNYLPRINELYPWYGWLVYKEGEFILHFMADQYKDRGDVIGAILKESTRSKFAEAFRKVTGDSLEEFDRKLWQYIEKRYSSLRAKTDIAEEAKSVGNGTLLAAYDNFFITRKEDMGREALFLNWTNSTITKSKKLVEGGRLKSVDMRGLPLDLSPEFGFQEHGASFASSTTLLYAMDVGGRDSLVIQNFLFNSAKKKIKLRKKIKYQFESVREIQYPVMIDENRVAFVGRDDGVFAELFLADLKNKSVKKLTSLQRTYRGLTYSRATNSLITSIENKTTDSYDLAIYDLSKETLSLLTETPENEFYAVCSPDGKQLLYVSDKDLVHNVYRYSFETRKTEVPTDAKIGIFRPQWFDKNGMAFNWFSRGMMAVKTAPLPDAPMVLSSTNSIRQLNLEAEKELSALKARIPGVDSMTIFDAVISSDKTKALFVENRKLSMEILGKGEAEIRFHLVDTSTSTVLQFTIDEFKKMKHYGSISLLAGTNILLQKHSVIREEVNDISDRNSRPYEEEVTYKESYIYNWQTGELHDIDTEIESGSSGNNRYLSKLSPDLRYLIRVASDRTKIILYDVITKEKKKLQKEFYEIQGAEFISSDKILVLDKQWNIHLSEIDVGSDTSKTWEKILPENVELEKTVAWYPLSNGTTVFLVVPRKETGLDIFLFNTASSSLTLAASEIPLVKRAELKDGALNLTIANAYGLDRIMKVTSSGTVEVSDEKFPYSVIHSSYGNKPGLNPVLPRHWSSKLDLPWRTRQPNKLPRVMYAQGVGGIAFGSNSGFGAFLAMRALAFDEINNKALGADIYLQNSNYGFANIQYYNFVTSRSYLLDYWNFDGRRHKLDVGVSQNIFLHEFLNWDVTFKQQQVRNQRDSGTTEWFRSKIGTTLSLDTTIWDCQANQWYCHGPHSGAAVFTGTELGFDYKKGFQNMEVNADARYYLPMTQRSGLAFRALAGKSFGPNPTTFIWGGNQSFRGIPLFSQAGDTYLMQSTEIRFPILNAVGAVISGPIGEAFAPLTLFMDIRGGLYHDIGDMWYAKTPLFDGHQEFKMQQSAGYFVNVPTIFGINARFNKGLYGKQDWNFWLGYNW